MPELSPPSPLPSFHPTAGPEPGRMYASIVESLGGIVWRADGSTFRFSFVSSEAERILGYPAEEWLTDPDFWRAHTHPDDVAWTATFCLDATASGRNHEFEYRMIAADGRVVWLRDIVTVTRDPDGSVQLCGIMLDITDRKVAEAALRASEERLALAQVAGQVGTFDWDVTTDTVVWSPQLEALYGFAPGGFSAPAWFRSLHPDDLVDAIDATQRAMDEGVLDAEWRVVWPDGSIHWLHARGRASDEGGRPRRMLGVAVDVTREKEAEVERLRLVNTLQERVKELTALHGAARLLFGARALTEEVLAGLAALLPPAFQHPEMAAARVCLGEREAATPGFAEGEAMLTAAFTAADGSPGRVDVVYGMALPAAADDPFLAEERSLVESIADMLRTACDRASAQAGLRASEERYRLVATATNDILYDLDVVTGRSQVSETLSRVWGYPPGVKSMDWWRKALHPGDAERVTEKLQLALSGTGDVWVQEYRFRRHDGGYLNVLDRGHISRDAQGRAVRIVGSVMDVTARTHLEEQLRQSQKLEALGRLAGGVAHDFNNLLTVITGYSDFLADGREPDDPVRRDVEEIRRAADRASLLTQQLLAFGRKQVRHPEVVDLNASVREVSKMLARLIGEDVALQLELAPEGGAVLADAGQLQQVVMNLSVNARDAMPGGGTLRLETRHQRVEADADLAISPGHYVVLAVSDTGTGMSPEVQARIFEPFFTTKEAGKGTGLGLATVYGIVEQSHGQLRVESAEGRGTTFEIYFPRVGVLPPEPVCAPTARATRGSGTILLVEDDESLRRVAVRILGGSGYRVLAATDTTDALRLSRAEGEPIDLLITDVVMPGMSGPELAARIEATRPGMKVLFMSGYTDDALGQHGILEEGIRFIQKPFTVDALAARVQEVLTE